MRIVLLIDDPPDPTDAGDQATLEEARALPALVDDITPLRPQLVYGAHKAMTEQWLATLSRRGALDALSLRLPGIVARPPGPSGMKSAFMSDVFHALRVGKPFTSPVAADATMWLMSVETVVAALLHALTLDAPLPDARPARRGDIGSAPAASTPTAGGPRASPLSRAARSRRRRPSPCGGSS